MVEIVNTLKAPKAIGPYSQAIVWNEMVFTSGQIPIDPVTGQMMESDIEVQAEQVMKNIEAVLKEAGTTLEKVLKTTCFLSSMEDFVKFNSVYEKYFTCKPARSCVAVKELPKKALCEVEVIAVREK